MEQNPALAGDVTAEQDVDVVEIPSEQCSPGGSPDWDSILAVICCIDVLFSLGIVELRRATFDDHVIVGALAKIDAWLSYRWATRGDRRDVRQVKNRQAFGGLLGYR